ncbi:hypothetical protein STEG23_017967, partial [Scotinomys teguina]
MEEINISKLGTRQVRYYSKIIRITSPFYLFVECSDEIASISQISNEKNKTKQNNNNNKKPFGYPNNHITVANQQHVLSVLPDSGYIAGPEFGSKYQCSKGIVHIDWYFYLR